MYSRVPLATIPLPKVSDIFLKYHHHMSKQIHMGHLPFIHRYSKVLFIKILHLSYCIFLYTVYTQRWLFEKCLFHSFSPYQDNKTPLYVASENGYHDGVKTLLGAGADVNIARYHVSDGIFYFCTI